MDELKYYNSPITLEQAEQYIQSGLITAARAYVANGYYLRRIREDKLFEESGYQNFEDYVRGKYNKDKGWASKCIKVNQQLSEGGDSPILSKQYLEFSTYQLVELAYMTEEQREEAAPDMTVNQLKQIRKPEETVELEKSCDVTTSEPEEEQDQEEAQEKHSENNQESGTFNSTPTSCPHREGYSCTVLVENKSVPGDGNNCGSSCCWSCKFHGACKLECNASAGRDGEIPEYDAVWFVKEWGVRSPGDLKSALMVCRDNTSNAERAKAVQKELSPYGSYSHSCGTKYDFSFRSFAKGIDLRIGKVDFHFTYVRFVQELMSLYPDFREPVSKEPEVVIEEPESIPDQEENVPECHETVIDGEYEEILPDLSAPIKTVLEEAKKTLKDWMSAFEGEVPEKWPPFIERQKIIVAALAAMVCDLEVTTQPEQPELPLLKNNDQRASFIDAYATWPIWIETKETGERYYRYDLTDKVTIVVKVYWKHTWESYKESKDYEYGAEHYYLMGVKPEWRNGKNVYVEDESRTFYECGTNRSALVDYLKEFQKSK